MTGDRSFCPPRWWMALPDTAAAAHIAAELLGPDAPVLATHPSTRPWLLGTSNWTIDTITVGRARAALLGARRRTADELHQATDAVGRGDTKMLVRQPALFHLLMTAPGTLDAAGDVSGAHPVWWTRRGDTVLIASHARLLTTRADVDNNWLVARLLQPAMPRAIAHQISPYPGVHPVAPGHTLDVTDGERIAASAWWEPPPAALSLADGACLLRHELTQSIRDRAAAAGSMSVSVADLYATALAVLAARALPDVGLLRVEEGRDETANEVVYARAAEGLHRHVDHLRRLPPAPDRPAFTAHLDAIPTLAEPVRTALAAARTRRLMTDIAEWGARAHLSGFGGPHVLLAPTSYLRRLDPNTPLAQSHQRNWALTRGIAPHALHAALAEPETLTAWLHRQADSLTHNPDPIDAGWEPQLRAPTWLTPTAVTNARDLIDTAAGKATPLADQPWQHATLAAIQTTGHTAGLTTDLVLTLAGIPVEYVYLDRPVIEAVLATPPEHRTHPNRGPLLLTAALPNLPQPQIERRQPGPTADTIAGLIANRHHITEQLTHGALAARGLIDPTKINAVLDDLLGHRHHITALIETLATETWLRTTP